MKNVGSVIGDMLKGSSLGRTVRLSEIWASWDKIAGPDFAPHGRPLKVVGKVLYVGVDSGPQQHKASFMKETMLSRVHAFTGGRYIRDIVFRTQRKPHISPKTVAT